MEVDGCHCHQHREFCASASFRYSRVSPDDVDPNTWSRATATSRARSISATSRINRYYDPKTDQFISIDPMVAKTDQPYAFVNDSPLNSTDPLGLKIAGTGSAACNIQSGSNVRTIVCNGQSANGTSAAGVIVTTPTATYDVLTGILTVSSTISIAGTNGVSIGSGGVTITSPSGNATATIGLNGSVSGSVGVPLAPPISLMYGGVSASSPTASGTFDGHKYTAQTTESFYPWGDSPPPDPYPAYGVGASAVAILLAVWLDAKPVCAPVLPPLGILVC